MNKSDSRVLAKDISQHIDKQIVIKGWLHKKRLMGGLNFVTIRDRSGLVQMLVEKGDEVEKLRGMQVGTVLEVAGSVFADERAPGGAEIHDPVIIVLTPVTDEPPIEIDKPLGHKPDNLDTLFDNRSIGLRNIQERAIFQIQSTICRSIREHFYANDFTEMHTPKLLAEPTEGGAEVFTLDYFGKVATLAQSPQFYKQMMVGVFERVFEIAPVFRAELSATTRHMSEYTSVDGEMGFIGLSDLEDFLGSMLSRVVDDVWENHGSELKRWNTTKPLIPEQIPELTITEIHEMYKKATGEDYTADDDLAPSEEKWVCEWSRKNKQSDAVFVIGWPADSKTFKFYHRANEKDSTIADRADLLFRGVEIVTLSMREHRYDQVVAQMVEKGVDPNESGFQPLLSAMRYGMPTHGGFGLGLERLTQKIVGLANVKEAALFPRDINRLTP